MQALQHVESLIVWILQWLLRGTGEVFSSDASPDCSHMCFYTIVCSCLHGGHHLQTTFGAGRRRTAWKSWRNRHGHSSYPEQHGVSELPQVRLHYDDFDRRNMSKQITTEVPVLLLRHPIRECFI